MDHSVSVTDLGTCASCVLGQWPAGAGRAASPAVIVRSGPHAPLSLPYKFGIFSLSLSPHQALSFSLKISRLLFLSQFLSASLQVRSPMAQVSITKALMVVFVAMAIFSTASTVSAQAPAPSPDVGSAFSLPLSGAVIASSVIFSLLALLKH